MCDTACQIYHKEAYEIITNGAYLKRVNEKGVLGIWECSPNCQGSQRSMTDTLLAALEEQP